MVQQTYSELSIKLTNSINKDVKKQNGIFFTPPDTINKNLIFLKPYFKNNMNILEPSCGSCEYILSLNKICDNLNITGIEYNKTIYDSIQHLQTKNITILNKDYLTYYTQKKYDLIIGNPPYYVMKKKNCRNYIS